MRTPLATPDPRGDDWLTTKQVAALLGVTPRTVYTLVADDTLPAYKFGRTIRYLRAEVKAVRGA